MLKTDLESNYTTLIRTNLLKTGQTGHQIRSDRTPRAAQQPKQVRPVPKSGQTGFAQIGEFFGAITHTPELRIRRSICLFRSSRRGLRLGALKPMI